MPRLARSLETLRHQVDQLAPNREKDSDGWIGDTSHQARKSEHNPDANGVVRALDITNDPAHGVDSQALAEQLRQAKDPRILYLISNRRIASSKVEPWTWRPYSGSNPHDHHMHISVVEDPRRYDATDAWTIHLTSSSGNAGFAPSRPRIKQGDSNAAVAEAQRLLGINVSGTFDAAMDETVRAFQATHGLSVDGIIGPYTWDQLSAASGSAAVAKRQTGITATVFGGTGEVERSAYDGHRIAESEFGVALPFRFKGARPDVNVTNPANGKAALCQIVDVGPWNTDDPYWAHGTRPQAESGIDERGRKTNRAGIDLSPAAARALGINGMGKVDWEFAGTVPGGGTGTGGGGGGGGGGPAPPPEYDPQYGPLRDLIQRLEAKLNMPGPDATVLDGLMQRLGHLERLILANKPTRDDLPFRPSGDVAMFPSRVSPTLPAGPNDVGAWLDQLLPLVQRLQSQGVGAPPSAVPQTEQLRKALEVLTTIVAPGMDLKSLPLGQVNGALGETLGKLLDGKKTAIGVGGAALTSLLAHVPAETGLGTVLGLLTPALGLSPFTMPIFLAFAAWGILGKFEKWAQGTAPPPRPTT
jgi:putative peptidoglycan binding protein